MQKKHTQKSFFNTGQNLDLLYGQHAVTEALKNPFRKHKEIFYHDQKSLDCILQQNISLKSTKLSRDIFDSELGSGTTHQGIALLTSKRYEFTVEDFLKKHSDASRIIALDHVTDPQNIGAIIRTAAAFDIDAVLLTEHQSPRNLDRALAKNASGAIEHIQIIRTTNLQQALQKLQQHDFWSFAFDERGSTPLNKTDFSGKTILLFGAEGKGLRRLTKEKCDTLVTLPTNKGFGTLNVSCTVAACLWELQRQSLKD